MTRQYDHRSKDDKIRRTKERRALLWRMEEGYEAHEEKKVVQAKSSLEIGASDDAQEQHADAVAKKVVSGENVSGLLKNQPSATAMSCSEEKSGSLMAKSEDGTLKGTEQLQAGLNSSKGGGNALEPKLQAEMGEKMGADLSDVKIHTDGKAHDMSEGINAKAFTHGQDIYFKQGNFDTSTNEGKKLLTHELAHTQQQKDGLGRKVQRWDEDDLDNRIKPHRIRIVEGHLFADKTKKEIFIPVAYGKVTEILVRDVAGKWQEKAITYSYEKDYIDLRALPKGTYFVSIFTTKNPHKDRLETVKYKVVHDIGPLSERPDHLQSPLFRSNSKLEKAYESRTGSFKSGSSGNHVKRVQYALLQLGYYLGKYKDDGSFGDFTESAIIKFQGDYLLKEKDGIVGPDTMYQLDRLSLTFKVPANIDAVTTNARIRILGKIGGAETAVDPKGYVTAKINGKVVGKDIAIKKIEVFNALGSIMKDIVLSDKLIDLRSCPKGVYIISFEPVEDLPKRMIRVVKIESATLTLDSYDNVNAMDSGMTDKLKEVKPINKIGKIAAGGNDYSFVKTKGANAYINPAAAEQKAQLSAPLLYNQEVHVIGSYIQNEDWLLIQTKSKETAWISSVYVKYPMPSADANLHYIQKGEQLMQLVLDTYGANCDFVMCSVAVILANKGSAAFFYDPGMVSLSFWDTVYAGSGDLQYLSQKIQFQAVKLKTGFNIWLPGKDWIALMRGTGEVVTSDKWTRIWERTVDAAFFVAGLVVGVFEGIWKGITETIEGIVGLVELIGDIASAIWNGKFTEYIKGIWNGIVKAITDFPDKLMKALDDFASMSAWDKGITVGTIIGMVIFEILLAIFTLGIVTAVKWSGRFARLVRILRLAPDVDGLVKKIDVDPPAKNVSDDINKKIDEPGNDQLVKKEKDAPDVNENKKTDSKEKSDNLESKRVLLNGEGKVGSYSDLIKSGTRGDNLTPHHIPSDAFNKKHGVSRDDGVAIMVEHPHPGTGGRHRRTKTYGGNMTSAERNAYYKLTPNQALEFDVEDLRRVYKEDGLYTETIEKQLQQIISENKRRFPNLYK